MKNLPVLMGILAATIVSFAQADDAESLGGKGLVYEMTVEGSLELRASVDAGSIYYAAFRAGAPVAAEDGNIFAEPTTADYCWFSVSLSDEDFMEYLDKKQYPALILDSLKVELQESSIVASATGLNNPWKVEQVDFVLHTVGPARRADGKPTESVIAGFSCRGKDLRVSAVHDTTGVSAITRSRPAK